MPNDAAGDLPLISCVMPTYGRPAYVNEAVWMFLEQDYPNKELVVLNDCVGQTFECDPAIRGRVRIINCSERFPNLGAKRNACIQHARGDLIAVWDDDDVYLPWRLSFSYAQMRNEQTSFYRAAEFWAYWGEEHLHDNQSVPGWVNHPNTLFTKKIWEEVGGYPHADVGEDAQFFDAIHRAIGETFLAYPVERRDRFFILRGKSQYPHLSIGGGEGQADTRLGTIQVRPRPIGEPLLRGHYRRLVRQRVSSTAADTKPDLSVCVSLKNRSWVPHDGGFLPLFPNAVEALAEAAAESGYVIELVVADFQSDDAPPEGWIDDLATGLLVQTIQVDGGFSRGRGLNLAADQARSDRLLLMDADVLIDAESLHRAVSLIDEGKAWVPIFRFLDEHGEPEAWNDFGHGIVGLPRWVFEATGGVPEFESWGGEDNIFNDLLHEHVQGVREQFGGLRHQWHPVSCQDQYYRRPRQSDYHDYVENQKGNGQSKGLETNSQEQRFRKRDSQSPRRILIGLGTGCCGTESLANLLGLPHEAEWPMPWEYTEDAWRQRLRKIRSRGRFTKGDVGFYYLNSVDYLDKAFDCRFICIQRDRQEVMGILGLAIVAVFFGNKQ